METAYTEKLWLTIHFLKKINIQASTPPEPRYYHSIIYACISLHYICMCHIHSLATLLGTLASTGLDPLFFRTVLILRGIDSTRCWKHCSEILVYIDMIASRSCCRFVVCTSMMRISRSTTSQRCSIGLRSGDCGGHLSKVNSSSCSRNQSEMIWSLWHGALSCWKYIRRWYTVVIKGWTWSATILR